MSEKTWAKILNVYPMIEYIVLFHNFLYHKQENIGISIYSFQKYPGGYKYKVPVTGALFKGAHVIIKTIIEKYYCSDTPK